MLRVSQRCPSIANGQEMSMLERLIGFLQQESIRPAPLVSGKQQHSRGRGRWGRKGDLRCGRRGKRGRHVYCWCRSGAVRGLVVNVCYSADGDGMKCQEWSRDVISSSAARRGVTVIHLTARLHIWSLFLDEVSLDTRYSIMVPWFCLSCPVFINH